MLSFFHCIAKGFWFENGQYCKIVMYLSPSILDSQGKVQSCCKKEEEKNFAESFYKYIGGPLKKKHTHFCIVRPSITVFLPLKKSHIFLKPFRTAI